MRASVNWLSTILADKNNLKPCQSSMTSVIGFSDHGSRPGKRSLDRFELGILAVDDLEDDVSRLHLTVWQELDVAEHGVLDSLSADRRCHGLAVQRFGGFDGLCPNLYGGGAERRALVGS